MGAQLLRYTEVARILNISREAACQLVQQGQIASVKFNTTVRVRPEDLETFIRSSWVDASGNEVPTFFSKRV